jgi:hypothetical protein
MFGNSEHLLFHTLALSYIYYVLPDAVICYFVLSMKQKDMFSTLILATAPARANSEGQ